MAADAASETSKFPAADVDKELHPGHNEKLEVDGVSSGIVTSRDLMVILDLDSTLYKYM